MMKVQTIFNQRKSGIPGESLLVMVCITIFVIPVFPLEWHGWLFNIFFTAIFLTAALAMQRYKKIILRLAVAVMIIEWLASLLDMLYLEEISKITKIIFFIIIVVRLIIQIAGTKKVTNSIIVAAVNGYLLLGMAFTLLVALIMLYEPEAYGMPALANFAPGVSRFSEYIYYSFVTFTTIGYGDVLPKLPYSKSLAILTGIAGQMYVAIILAMLVGKYASSSDA